ncbi:MAG: hypothetical protein ABIN80_13625 [Dyadobacter sp.]|uniref:hypothetical protein n=1 Tax=Dyadobacter sp. TaxID=1914288 RepID=UPI003263B0C6
MGAGNTQLENAYNSSYLADTPNSGNCSGFLKSLGRSLGINIPEKDADGIIAELNSLTQNGNFLSVWEKLGTGTEALESAKRHAGQGRLVIAAMTAADYGQNNGHVAVVLPKVGQNNAPLMYGGGAARTQGDKTIRQVWNPTKHDKLQFFMHRTIFLGAYE